MSESSDPRVLFAAERTLLAWNRTCISLTAFGFVVERLGLFLQLLGRTEIKVFSAPYLVRRWRSIHAAGGIAGYLRHLATQGDP